MWRKQRRYCGCYTCRFRPVFTHSLPALFTFHIVILPPFQYSSVILSLRVDCQKNREQEFAVFSIFRFFCGFCASYTFCNSHFPVFFLNRGEHHLRPGRAACNAVLPYAEKVLVFRFFLKSSSALCFCKTRFMLFFVSKYLRRKLKNSNRCLENQCDVSSERQPVLSCRSKNRSTHAIKILLSLVNTIVTLLHYTFLPIAISLFHPHLLSGPHPADTFWGGKTIATCCFSQQPKRFFGVFKIFWGCKIAQFPPMRLRASLVVALLKRT